jgi:hypothetical protein
MSSIGPRYRPPRHLIRSGIAPEQVLPRYRQLVTNPARRFDAGPRPGTKDGVDRAVTLVCGGGLAHFGREAIGAMAVSLPAIRVHVTPPR